MKMPKIGMQVQVLVDSSFVHRYLVDSCKYLVAPKSVIHGTVMETPAWMSGYLTIFNNETKTPNYIAPHLIMSINNEAVVHPKASNDVITQVLSSDGKQKYTVCQDGKTKKWSCSCSGFQFRGRCKHITLASKI
jgi:hypothetical protein